MRQNGLYAERHDALPYAFYAVVTMRNVSTSNPAIRSIRCHSQIEARLDKKVISTAFVL